MQSIPPRSSPSASADLHVATARNNLASIRKSQPTHLHNVDIYIWETSYQSAIVTPKDIPTPVVTPAPSPSTPDSGSSSQPQDPRQSPIEDTDQHHSISPTTSVAIDTDLSLSPPGEALPAHNRGNRRALCPECRAYASKRSFNMKRHRKACHKKATNGRPKSQRDQGWECLARRRSENDMRAWRTNDKFNR
ncbi:uncharacterized protein FFB20_11653 [Fusarium fujikuroi]|nr:uncharacterized protein FFE2_02425 [Fusarium fujikuroi]SCO02666.1 uncharacterized protein FFB20_11653 [Fusarium fujikuroi]SCO03265.1 uncharacterized protein FFC1_09259 [Fusarium fujikuroi]SCO35521.1 uncharacterized protein FFNC_04537 [Fusarium fujikuroi]SCV37057.1 uncharacterized protein FFFS_05488 [Fusarium fujikuroi]